MDYNVRNMAYLKLPSRVPTVLVDNYKAVGNQFTLNQVNLEDIDSYSKGEHLKTTRLLTMEELEEALAVTSQNAVG
ncbi:unnamed protein product [Eruca vesicaria subsp. sativa]|uniref:Uncharacterized protein n=1 Tax=Eruca vesicaria subsp. sativa TaxID=29727 RepID=A0ABC8JH47_ERUVS|nr:unnamed protein product [Eruca vesicaria subsp. sativa]